MNVTPEVIKRLRRLASLVPKKGNTPRNGQENNKELHEKSNENVNVNGTSTGGGSVSVENGRLSPAMNGSAENEPTTPGNKQGIGEGEIKMDMDVFRQILKEVILKRTFAIEKKLMGDIEALKKQVFDLESQKKILQNDSERLMQTLKEISSKQEKQKVQMASCGTQVDMDLVQERPLSPEISKQTKPIAQRAATTDSGQVSAYKSDAEAESLEQIKTDDRTRTSEFRVSCYDSGISSVPNVPVAAEDATKASAQEVIELSVRSCSQGQGIAVESLATRDQQNGLQSEENPQTPSTSAHRRPQEFRVEQVLSRQEQGNILQQAPRLEIPQHTQTRGPPRLRPRIQEVTSGNPHITGQGYSPQMPAESSLTRRPQFSSSKWISSQSQQPNQQVRLLQASRHDDLQSQPHPSVNHVPLDQANHSSVTAIPRGPPNVSLFNSPKRRRVEKRPASDGNNMHVVASNNNYVMHNFKVQKPIWTTEGERGQNSVRASRPLPANRLVFTNSPSNQSPGTYSSQGALKSQPAVYREQYPLPATDKAPDRSPAGLSQGQLVERVFYPSSRLQPANNEYHSAQRVMSAHHRRHIERGPTSGQPVEPNGTVYVVQEYQVSRNRVAPLQPIAPAPPAVPRNPAACPPVQSPGISSTASPSGYRPGESNAGHVQRAASNQSDTSAVRSDHPQNHLKTPPKPTASIVVVQDGIVLSWNMRIDDGTAKIDNYELFACQDGAESTNPPIMWKKIGIVKALPLPMACTLTQFSSGNKYHFAVRAVDDQERAGPFSDPCTISLTA